MKEWVIPRVVGGEFVARMERVLDVYKRPYDENYPVICMDESPKQMIEDIATETIEPGKEARVDYEYIRHGMVNIFMCNEPLRGKRTVEITDTKTKRDWALFMKKIADEKYPNAKKITLVMDNFKTHDPSAFYETFLPEEAKRLWDRFEFVFTPKHGSWLDMAEIELHVLSRQCLSRHMSSKEEITKEVAAWEKERNYKDAKIDWQFKTEDSRIKLKKLYPSIIS